MSTTGRWALDHAALLAAMVRQRDRNGQTWADVGRETGLAAPTFHRLVAGRSLSCDTYATLMAWLGQPLLYTAQVRP